MSKWEMVRLEDVCEILSGYAFDSKLFSDNSNAGMPLIRIRDIVRGFTQTYTTEEYDDKYVIKKGDLLIGMDGEFNIALWNSANSLLNQRVCKIKSFSNSLSEKYLFYFMPRALKEIEQSTSFVTVKHLSVKTIYQIEIPLPPLEVQKQIADILDKTQEIIDGHKKQLKELDNLTKAVFYDMFGDPVTNERGWKVSLVKEYFNVKTGRTPNREYNEYWNNGTIPWIKTTEIKENCIYDSEEYITELAAKDCRLIEIPKGSLLIAMYGQGQTRGRTAKLMIDATTNQACAALVIKTDNINVDFIWNYLIISYEQLRALARGGNQPNLNKNLVENFNLFIPPLDLQNKFVTIVTNIEEQKAIVKKSIEESQNLFNSLMNKYFE